MILVAIVLSGWVYFTWDNQRRQRVQETAQRASEEYVDAWRIAGQAEQAGLAGVGLWQDALKAARRAEEIVATDDAYAELKEQVVALVQDLERREEETRAAALREESHDVLLERLVEVRIGPDVPRIDLFAGPERRERESTRRAREYAELFDGLGFDGSTPVEEAAAIFDCPHRERWALVLDAWAEARRVEALFASTPSTEGWRQLVRTARRIDPDDPWRNALRDELGREELDAGALRALAGTLRGRNAEEVAIVVSLLDAAGDLEGALATQTEGMFLHPSDYWLNHSFSGLCNTEELLGRIHGEMQAWSTRAALVLRPASRAARFDMSLALFMEDQEGAEELLEEVLREDPDDQTVQAWNFMLLMSRGRFDDAAALFPDVLPALQRFQIDWDYGPFVNSLGYLEAMFDTPGLPPIMQGFLHVWHERYEEAWEIIDANRDQIDLLQRRCFFVPFLVDGVRSGDDLRANYERLRNLTTADDDVLRATPARELLAAAELVNSGWNDLATGARLFERAFENDPSSKELWASARARLKASFWAALASGGVTPLTAELSTEQRSELRELALAWMHEELDVIERDLVRPDLTREMAASYSRNLNAMNVYGWHAPIREPEYLARMPPEDAHACRVVWARIKGLGAMLVDLSLDKL